MKHTQTSREIDSVEAFAALLKNLPGMAYRCSNHPDWPMVFVSDGCFPLSGYSHEEFEQSRVLWGDLVHADDKDRIWHATQDAISKGLPYEYEYRIVNRSGEQRWVWERGRISEQSDGIGNGVHLDGIINDITYRKKTENDLLDARSFSNAVVEATVEAIITIDVRGTIEAFNRAAQDMFGYSIEAVRGHNVDILMPEPFHSEHAGYISRYLTTHEPRIIGIGREVLAQRADGSVFPIHLSVSEVKAHPERKFVGLIRDISIERAAQEHLDQLAHVDRLNILGEMASGIAHEINQPLTAVSLFSQAGKRLIEAGNFEKLPDIFDKLSEHAERAGDIMERMQTLARRGEKSREIVQCNPMVQDVARLAEAEARLRSITIVLKLHDDLPQIEVDIVQIQQVVLNLLRNAMEAMQSIDCAGGNMVTLETRLEDGDIEIRVIDTGCGVAQADAAKVFTPFSTTKDSGMGLGLSLSRTIINMHGGQISFRNNDSQGATFFFTLPAAD